MLRSTCADTSGVAVERHVLRLRSFLLANTVKHLTSDGAFCSARFDEHTGDKGRATRPARALDWMKQGALVVKADVQVKAILTPIELKSRNEDALSLLSDIVARDPADKPAIEI